MSLQKSGYISRIAEGLFDLYLEVFGAVEIRGPKWCGKTWLALSRAASLTNLDDRAQREAALIDGRITLVGDRPHLIDEWQRVPGTRDLVRTAVDEQADTKGAFILTGSSTPRKSQENHSGAGRIARIDLSTMTMFERGLSDASISLEKLFDGTSLEPQSVDVGLEQIATYVVRGGWPAAQGLSDRAASMIARQYIAATCDPDYLDKKYDPIVLRRTLLALARNDGTSASLDTLARDASAGEQGKGALNADAVKAYLSHIEQSYLAYELGGWEAPVRSRARVRTKPKRYLCDPSLSAYLLGMNTKRLLLDTQTLGILFENLCVHDVIAYARAAIDLDIAGLYYYRDSYGLETDLIIELADGRWAALEVKLSAAKVADAQQSLLRLAEKVADNPAARNPKPAFLAVITGVSTIATTTEAGVHVIPITCLGV